MSRTTHNNIDAELTSTEQGNENIKFILQGRLDADSTAVLWPKAQHILHHRKYRSLTVVATGVNYCDAAGAALMLWLRDYQEIQNGSFQLHGLNENFEHLMKMLDPGVQPKTKTKPYQLRNILESIGKGWIETFRDFLQQIAFVGELTYALKSCIRKPSKIRWSDVFIVAEAAGADAISIVALVGFLFGLILAFQAAVSLKEFGAELYVADAVALSLFKVMGPFITAVVFAARSGSAFAAELGTMNVNEEIDALTTMGLDPVRFLAVPRVIAAMVVTPMLTVFANIFGLIGGFVVMLSLGFPMVTYANEIRLTVTLTDFASGLFKALVFGIIVASVGCLRGLQTKAGSRSVGNAATRAVVTSIVLIVVAEGIFAVLFYYLGI